MMVSSPDIVARMLALGVGVDRDGWVGGSWELERDRAKMHYQRRSTAGAAAWVGACCGWTSCAAEKARSTRILPREFAFKPGRRRECTRKSSGARVDAMAHTHRAETRSSQASGSGRPLRQPMPQPAALRQSCGGAEEMGC